MCSELQALRIEACRRQRQKQDQQIEGGSGGAAERKDSNERARAMATIAAVQRVLQVIHHVRAAYGVNSYNN